MFDHLETIPSGISNVCNFENHVRIASLRRGNIARVSYKLGQTAICMGPAAARRMVSATSLISCLLPTFVGLKPTFIELKPTFIELKPWGD